MHFFFRSIYFSPCLFIFIIIIIVMHCHIILYINTGHVWFEWVEGREGKVGANLFTAVLTYDDPQAEDEDHSLGPHLEGGGLFQSKLPPGILPHGLPQVKDVQPAVTASRQKRPNTNTRKKVRESLMVKHN